MKCGEHKKILQTAIISTEPLRDNHVAFLNLEYNFVYNSLYLGNIVSDEKKYYISSIH